MWGCGPQILLCVIIQIKVKKDKVYECDHTMEDSFQYDMWCCVLIDSCKL